MEVQQDFHLQQHRRQAWQRPPTTAQHVNIHHDKAIK